MTIQSKVIPPTPPKTEQDFPIVGIGASAGGLDAFKRFLQAVPVDSGMAYVLVQHLDPTHESILPELLSRVTSIPVLEIENHIHLAPNTVYVIPENKILTSEDGILTLTERNKKKTSTAIDVFLTTLAEVHESFAIGIVLSGTGSDGTLGLKAIKAHGGITFAQDQLSAKFGEMPQSAIHAEVVDFVLTPEQMPDKLVEIFSALKKYKNLEEALAKEEEDIFNQIIITLCQRSGVDFTYYKQTTVRRRIARRMVICEKADLAAYLKYLQKNQTEQDALFNDMLIPVTSFFRDAKIFQTISLRLFPELLVNKSAADPIRIWIAGCSTGEEVYSLAISLHQFLEKVSGRQIQIFASDISESAIAKARIGCYRDSDVKNIPELTLKNYFTKSGNGHQVNQQIREMCVFAVHDFLKDPPFAKMDLISCRNVLIYMDVFLQRKALSTFHYALKEHGFLVLGKSETTGPAAQLFSTFAKDDKIYSRKAVPNRFVHYSSERKEINFSDKAKKLVKPELQQNDFRKTAESILISRFTPANVIVNDQMDVVQINGNIHPFLEAPQGKPTFNLLKMAREGLSFELRNTLHKAKAANASAVKEGILVKYDGKIMQIAIDIMPLPNSIEPYFLIVFQKILLPAKQTKANGNASPEKIVIKEANQRIEQLENEITLTREDMRSITEDQESANEELQSANEELLSSSEELQSLNEELETSKEELQSTNEELIIINQEMLDKQEQINSKRLYAEAIIATIREPLVVLDKELRIKSINPSFSKMFNLQNQEEEGCLIYELHDNMFDNLQLRALLEKGLPQKKELSDYEVQITLPNSGERTLLLNARRMVNERNKEQLILLALEDVTERKQLSHAAELATKIAEEERGKAEKGALLAEEALKSKQQFLSNMSHEIRTPLNSIIGFTKVILKTELNVKQREYLKAIQTSGDALIVLINDILDLAKVDAGKMAFVQAPLKLASSVSIMLHLFETKIQEKNLTLHLDYDKTIPEVLLGDSVRLHQIILNLVSNAVKFTEFGGVKVSVNSLKEDMQKVTIQFVVSDTGIGIPEDKFDTVFEKFQQVAEDTASRYGGTGLGLAIVKQLVEGQGGTVRLESTVGKGSNFVFVLDFLKTDAQVGGDEKEIVLKRELKNISVLVVEDLALNQLLMRTLLDGFGFKSDFAANGKIAIEQIQKKKYDIVLMDLQMPKMNGFEATKYIRQTLNSNIPIIALTADVTTVDIEKCLSAGMNSYLAKPVDEKLLYQKITDLLLA
jgi:two-component system CheB/CheR fusion protein